MDKDFDMHWLVADAPIGSPSLSITVFWRIWGLCEMA